MAVEPSESFVATIRARYPDVEVRQAPAERLPFPDDRFDAALGQLVVHFMQDPVAGLTEMRRVTRPDGVVAACVWDYEGNRGPLRVFWEEVRAGGHVFDDESDRPGVREGHLVELFEEAGLRQVEAATLTVSLPHAGFDEWWEPFTRGVGPAGVYLGGLDPDGRTELREACRRRYPTGPFEVTGVAWAARGLA